MIKKRFNRRIFCVLVFAASLWPPLAGAGEETVQDLRQAGPVRSTLTWQSPARLHHGFGGENGNLMIAADRVEFESNKGRSMKLPFLEVQTFRVSPHRLTIETYKNRQHHMPGIQRFTFDLKQAVPPEVAAELATGVQRPSQNALPLLVSQSIVIPAHHRIRTGGTNGTLRIGSGGIDYVTDVSGDSRSWRWADLQTLSSPDSFHLIVFGFKDTYSFDLKQHLPQSLYDRLTDAIEANETFNIEQLPIRQLHKLQHIRGQAGTDESIL